MPYLRSDWHEHIVEVWGEYKSTRPAVDRLRAAIVSTPDLLRNYRVAREYLSPADKNLEGTCIVRLFAAFEAALRSFVRARTAPFLAATDTFRLIRLNLLLQMPHLLPSIPLPLPTKQKDRQALEAAISNSKSLDAPL